MLLEGQDGGCRWSDVSAAIWPDLDPKRASTIFTKASDCVMWFLMRQLHHPPG
jgi:hypothetical protein